MTRDCFFLRFFEVRILHVINMIIIFKNCFNVRAVFRFSYIVLEDVAISCVMPSFILFTVAVAVAVAFAVAVGGVRHIHHVAMDFRVALSRHSIGSSRVVGIIITAV
jgi:hypothetical protein